MQHEWIGYPPRMRIIKKYSNRRLYDTQASAYVNLEQIAALVRAGDEIKVVAVSDGEDLTRQVLLQVVMEQQGGLALFPTGLLHRIIRFGGDSPFHRALTQQLSVGMELLDAQITRMERQYGWMRPDVAPPGFAADGAGPGYQATPQEPPPEEAAPEPEPEPAAAEPDAELDALRQRLADLEARLKR